MLTMDDTLDPGFEPMLSEDNFSATASAGGLSGAR